MTLAVRGAVQKFLDTTPNTVSAPAGLSAGDLIFEIAHAFQTPVAFSTGGLTAIAAEASDGGGYLHRVGQKVAAGSETTFDVTSGATGYIKTLLFALTGGDQATPYESYATPSNYSGVATYTSPSSTPTVDNCWHVIWFADTDSSQAVATPPSGYNLLDKIDHSGSSCLVAYYKDLGAGSAGTPTGTKSLVWTVVASGFAGGMIVRPDAGGASPSYPIETTLYF